LSEAKNHSTNLYNNLDDNFFLKLSLYFSLLNRWNSKLNLTRILSSEERIREEFLITPFIYALKLHGKTAKTLDIGSGNGIPGVFISLINSNCSVTLCEINAKKSIFLKEVIRELSITNVEVECCDYKVLLNSNVLFDHVTMKNVSVSNEFINSASKLLNPNGSMLFQTNKEKLNFLNSNQFDTELKPISYYNIPVHKETYLVELMRVPRGTI